MQIDFSLPYNFMSKILILVKQILVWKNTESRVIIQIC